jgi:hypothetical protein
MPHIAGQQATSIFIRHKNSRAAGQPNNRTAERPPNRRTAEQPNSRAAEPPNNRLPETLGPARWRMLRSTWIYMYAYAFLVDFQELEGCEEALGGHLGVISYHFSKKSRFCWRVVNVDIKNSHPSESKFKKLKDVCSKTHTSTGSQTGRTEGGWGQSSGFGALLINSVTLVHRS